MENIVGMDSKFFNRNYRVFVQCDGYRGFLGYRNFVALLDYASKNVLDKLSRQNVDKLVLRPFHGIVVISYLK